MTPCHSITAPSGSAFDALDLNQATQQLQPQPIIPSGTPVNVILDIKPGSYGCGGWLTCSQRTSTPDTIHNPLLTPDNTAFLH